MGLMKRLFAIAFVVCAAPVYDLRAAVQSLPFTDHFDYSEGLLTSVSGGTWFSSSTGPEISVSNSAALLPPDGFAAVLGKGVSWHPSGTARRALVQFGPVTSGTLYASFLLNVQAISSERLIAYFDDGSGSTTAPELGVFVNNGSIGIGKDAGTAGFSTSLVSGTHLVVVRYTFQAGNDQVDLWVDPPRDSYSATNAPTSSGNITGSGDPSALEYFAINANGSGPVAFLDELRIGTAWADVVPGTPPPPPSDPVITNVFLAPEGFVLRGSGGAPGSNYTVLTSTDLAVAPSNWVGIATNQFDSSGGFDVTNPVAPFDSERFYRLQVVGPVPVAPVITNQPQSQTLIESQTANFTVGASGTAPLYYQWYFNTNTPLANATNATLTLSNVSSNQAGVYSALVSNIAGTATSGFASLTVTPPPTNFPTVELVGFAAANGTTTGGQGGPTNYVTTTTDFVNAVSQPGPRTIVVMGTINLGANFVDVSSDKTIIGLGTNTTLVGNLRLYSVTNVILQNLNVTNPNGSVGDGDGITMWYSEHVWVDHCSFYNCADGECDMTHACDWITVSWCKFYYTANFGHNFACLIGHADGNGAEDAGKLRITMHHNWWSTWVNARMPRVRYGKVHVFNSFFNSPNNDYCILAAIQSELLIENNYFLNVNDTMSKDSDAKLKQSGNVLVDVEDAPDPGTDDVFTPPYSYTLEDATNVPGIVTNNAGAGKGPFAP
jgi:pectate lyase